jgi:hypothetical protein
MIENNWKYDTNRTMKRNVRTEVERPEIVPENPIPGYSSTINRTVEDSRNMKHED